MDNVYKWEGAVDWLSEKVQFESDPAKLRGYLNAIITELDGDTIQDIFQKEMEWDGFFVPINE